MKTIWKYVPNEMADLIYKCSKCGHIIGISYTEPEWPNVCPACDSIMEGHN